MLTNSWPPCLREQAALRPRLTDETTASDAYCDASTVPPPPSIAPEMTRRATVNGKTFRVRLAADVYVRSTEFKNMVVIFDDEALLYDHPQEGR